MLSSTLRARRTFYAALAAALTVSTAWGVAVVPPATAQEVEQVQEAPAAAAPAEEPGSPASEDLQKLVDRVADVAQRVAAKNEEVKASEDALAATEKEVKELQKRADDARIKADAAAVAVTDQQDRINGIAQSRYRGDSTSAVAAALDAADPGTAVERMGYLGALSRTAQRNLDDKAAAADVARGLQDEAAAAVKAAQDKAAELGQQRDRLLKEQEELETQKKEIEEKVDSLSEEQRAAFVGRFGAKDVDVAALSDGSGSKAVEAALTRLGAPYGWGATGPDVFDCSGLMVWSYQQMGKSIPRTSQAQLAGGTQVPLDQLEPGDIIGYYPGVTHVGMYVGDGKVVHASTYGVPVQVVPVDSMPIQGAVRY
ncbi:NlpC/P60 family protein [Corynebacterium sp. HMSC036D03]|uniref:C40 family peptidase n=1 Tax=Corynebacterium sp. HMSC036D03 TaxID=1715171 RepID=UPI000A579F48|nr:C40 family peptidase [Corynebacterium sp. HMSC036D03]